MSLYLAPLMAIAGLWTAEVAVAAPSHGARAGAPQQTQSDIRLLVQRLNEALAYGDAAGALAAAEGIAAHPAFGQAPAEARAEIETVIGGSLLALDRGDEGVVHLRRAIDLDPDAAAPWFGLLEHHAESPADIASVMSEAVTRSAEFREQVNPQYVSSLFRPDYLEDEAAFGLLNSLFEQGWRWEYDSWLWLRLTRERLERGDLEGAARAASAIRRASALIGLHGSRRYDEVRERAGLAALDLQALLDAELEDVRAGAVDLEGRQELANALFSRGLHEEALAVADAALVSLPTDDASPDWDQANWLMDTRARVLIELGRVDEALVEQERAAGRLESSGGNVSQRINLGWMYLRAGRPDEALAAISVLNEENASEFGLMQAMQVRACAAIALGDRAVADEALAYLRDHWRDAPDALYEALACRGDIDAMAALMIDRLADPDLADDAVLALHDYLPRAWPTAFDAELDAHFVAVAARPDVIAARDAVGRRLVVPTLGSQF